VYRRLVLCTAVLAAASACSVEPTPREYIDRQIPAEQVRENAEDELRTRINVLVTALDRGDVAAAEAALTPAADVVVVGPGEGERLVGPAQVSAVLELLANTDPGRLELADLQVDVNRRANAGWFTARLELTRPGSEEPIAFRATGVYLQREAAWQLQQAHFSVPSDALTAPAPPPAPASPTGSG
jgi:hypothetical protein